MQEDCPQEMTEFLLQKFGLQATDVYQAKGPVNLNRMMTILPMINRPNLRPRPSSRER